MRQYSYLKSQRINVANDTANIVVSLFANSSDNSSKSIATLTNLPECVVSEIISNYLGYRDKNYGSVADASRFHEVTESSIRDIAPIEHIIFQFNSKCYSSPDFSTRLQTLKTLR